MSSPVRCATYQASNPEVFASESAVKWFIRQNRAELVKAGAVVRPARELMIVPEAFDRAIVDIGLRKMQRGLQ